MADQQSITALMTPVAASRWLVVLDVFRCDRSAGEETSETQQRYPRRLGVVSVGLALPASPFTGLDLFSRPGFLQQLPNRNHRLRDRTPEASDIPVLDTLGERHNSTSLDWTQAPQQALRVRAEFTCHLDVGIRQPVQPLRLDPILQYG